MKEQSKFQHDIVDKLLIAFVIIYNVGLLVNSTLWLFTDSFYHIKTSLSTSNLMGLNEKVTYGLFTAGMLGGSFYCLRGLYQRLGEAYTLISGEIPEPKKVLNIKVWLFWYLFRPIQGGILALILLSLVNSKLLVSNNLDSSSVGSFYTQVAVGFLAGFGSHELIHKIEEIIKVTFAKAKSSSSGSAQKVKENKGE